MCSTDTDRTAMLSAAVTLTKEMGIDKLEQAERKSSCEQQADTGKRQREMCL